MAEEQQKQVEDNHLDEEIPYVNAHEIASDDAKMEQYMKDTINKFDEYAEDLVKMEKELDEFMGSTNAQIKQMKDQAADILAKIDAQVAKKITIQ